MIIDRDETFYRGYQVRQPFSSWPGLLCCGNALMGPKHHIHPHSHEGYEMNCLIAGTVEVMIERVRHKLVPGQVLLIAPATTHAMPSPHRACFHVAYVVLSSNEPIAQRLGLMLNGQHQKIIEASPSIEALFMDLPRLCSYDHDECLARSVLETLVALVARQAAVPVDAGGQIPGQIHRIWSEVVSRAVQEMRHHIGRTRHGLSIHRLASTCGVSHSTLKRYFLRETGLTPLQYQLYLRLSMAKRALASPEASVHSVAAEFGYSSPENFGRAFKRLFGVSPSAVRLMADQKGPPAAQIDSVIGASRGRVGSQPPNSAAQVIDPF